MQLDLTDFIAYVNRTFDLSMHIHIPEWYLLQTFLAGRGYNLQISKYIIDLDLPSGEHYVIYMRDSSFKERLSAIIAEEKSPILNFVEEIC